MNDVALCNLASRVGNDFYVGVVGSVRSGKSSFINKFFELKILPYIKDDFLHNKIIDELPQCAEGKTIMTVEPKFIPTTAVSIDINEEVKMNVRLVDCVGYVIPEAIGYETQDGPRLVKTPWFDEPIAFKEAALIGTKKVIVNHSNLGIVVTSDGSFSDFTRADYAKIDDEIIPQLIEMDKPFVIVLNTTEPNSKNAKSIKASLEEKYHVSVMAVNVLKMTEEDLNAILTAALNEFKISELSVELPDYIAVLGDDIELKAKIDEAINNVNAHYNRFKDITNICEELKETNLFKEVETTLVDAKVGKACIKLELDDSNYQIIINEILGSEVVTKADFVKELYEGKKAKKIYNNIGSALEMAKETGYGISIPDVDEMKLLPPTVIKQSGRYGVKLSAIAPSIHLIKVDVESSFTPIIGSEAQSQMLIENLVSDNQDMSEVWNKEIFGRRISEIVNDGIKAKIYQMPDKSKARLQNVLDRLVNSTSNGLIAIIL